MINKFAIFKEFFEGLEISSATKIVRNRVDRVTLSADRLGKT